MNLEKLLRLRVCPEGVPTMQEIYSLAARQPSDDALSRFCEIHNAVVVMLGNLYFFDRSFQDDLDLLKSICDRAGFDSQTVMIAQARLIYYRSVFAGSPTRLETASNLLEGSTLSPGVKAMIDRSQDEVAYLRGQFPEYQRSWNFWVNFERSIETLSQNDPTLETLVCGWKSYRAKFLRSASNTKQTFGSKAFGSCECPYCKKVFTFERKKGVSAAPPHCDDDFCRKTYETTRKKFSRLRSAAPRDWEAHWEKPRRCRQCRNRRLLDSERLCEECSSENLSQQEF